MIEHILNYIFTHKDILNIIGPIFGLSGTIMIFIYGVPKVTDDGGKDYWYSEVIDNKKVKQIENYKRNGNCGLFLVALSFFIQIVVGCM